MFESIVVFRWIFLLLILGECSQAFGTVAPVPVGQWPGYHRGAVEALEVAGDRIYIANREQGLEIMDVSDLNHPVHLGQWNKAPNPYHGGTWTPSKWSFAREVKAVGNLAFLLNGVIGIQAPSRVDFDIIDISNPERPVRVASYYGVDGANYDGGLDVVENVVYLADPNSGLQIVDVSNPSQPKLVGSYKEGGAAFKVKVSNNLAFIPNGQGIQILDVSDAASPKLLSLSRIGGWVSTVAGNLAYVTEASKILDFSDPRNPVIVGGSNVTNAVTGMVVEGNYAYEANDLQAAKIVDLSNPTNPVTMATFSTNLYRWTTDIALRDNFAFLAKDAAGFEIFDIDNPSDPVFVGRDENAGAAMEVMLVGQRAYLADHFGGMEIIDVSDPTKPVRLGGYKEPFANKMVVEGNLAFIPDLDRGLRIVDVSDAANPAPVGLYPRASGYDASVAVSGTVAFYNVPNLEIVDVSDPANPTLLSTYPINGERMVVRSNVLIAAGGGQLSVLDVGDPSHPAMLGQCPIRRGVGARIGFTMVGTTAYIAAEVLEIVDVSDPANPRLVGECRIGSDANGVSVAGNFAFVASWEAGLEMVDVSNPTGPFVVGKYFTGGYGSGSTVANGLLYVADMIGGMQIFRIETLPILQIEREGTFPTLKVNGEIGQQYVLEYASSLGGPVWNSVETFTLSSNPQTVTDGVVGSASQRFYRVRVGP